MVPIIKDGYDKAIAPAASTVAKNMAPVIFVDIILLVNI
jgi:hypothetical protein